MSESPENINELIQKLIAELIKLKQPEIPKSNPEIPHVIFDDDIEVEAVSGTPIKIDSKTYYRMIYADVNNLKKDTETLLNLYLDDVKPTLKSVDDNLKILTANFKTVEADVEDLKKYKPKTFKLWLEEKGKTAESIGRIAKFIFWGAIIIYILFTILPTLMSFVFRASGTPH